MATFTKEVGKIFETNDTSKFSIKKGNREINQKHVNRLKKAITQKDLRTPIEVDKNFNIMDGQHRFCAYRDLGKSFRYFINSDVSEVEDIQAMNNTSIKWILDDYLKSSITLGNENYQTFSKICDEYNISCGLGLTAFSISTYMFKSGKMEISLFKLHETKQLLDNLVLIKKHWLKPNVERFDRGIIRLLKTYPNIDMKHLIERMDKLPHMHFESTTLMGYVSILTDIYNYNLSKSKRLS